MEEYEMAEDEFESFDPVEEYIRHTKVEEKNKDSLEHDFTVKTWKEDFCLIVEDKRFYVARNILALASPVFERTFQADFKEKDQNEMELPDKLSADVEEFLKCLYPSIMKEVTIENAFQIIPLAEEYQVLDLKAKCETCFVNSLTEWSSAEYIFKFLKLASLYSLNTVKEKCTKLAVKKPLAELDRANEKVPISQEVNCAIHRKMIEEMKAKQDETDNKLDNLLVLNKYHQAIVASYERLNVNDFANWVGESVHTKIDSNSGTFTYGNICKSLFILKFQKACNGNLKAVISVGDKVIGVFDGYRYSQEPEIRLLGNIVVVNGMAGKKNFCKKVDMKFDRYKTSSAIDLLSLKILRDEGYIYNDEISIECNFLAKKMI